MHQFYKYLTLILLATAAIIGPILFIIFQLSPAPFIEQVNAPGGEEKIIESETPTPPERQPIKLLALGDIMLGRAVRTMYEKNGLDYLLGAASELFSGNTIIWANLEGPVLYDAPITPINGMMFAFATSSLQILKDTNINFLNLANNHGLDQSRKGFEETQKILRENNFVFMGDPAKIGAVSLATTTVSGRELALLGFNATWQTFKLDEAIKLIRETKSSSSRLVLVMIHWGEEYKLTHNAEQEKIARALIDAGAEVVFGHHPHVVQDIEKYNGKYILYSLGNFLFDQWFLKETQEGLAVEMSILDEQISYRLLPYKSARSAVIGMSGQEIETWLLDFAKRNPEELRENILKGRLD